MNAKARILPGTSVKSAGHRVTLATTTSSTAPVRANLTMSGTALETGVIIRGLNRDRRSRPRQGPNTRVESAVYAHIRAIKALGKDTVNTEEIAAALSLDVRTVNRAIGALKDKGVRAAK